MSALEGLDQVMAIWRKLCESTKANRRADWKLNFRVISVDADNGRLYWSAHYRFAKLQRPVRNRIHARFHFNAAGQIRQHHDTFDFWRWLCPACGWAALGWAPILRQQVRAKALSRLNHYIAGHPILAQVEPDPTERNL